MEYLAFDFAPFEVEKTVTSLEDFYHFVDCEFDFESFSDVVMVCLRDVVKGLDFLHRMELAHRDLRPSNILVSNQHYCYKDASSIAKEYEHCPIICKVADFGLSRSFDNQTQSTLQSRTSDIYRGTPVYMAPEIHIGLLKSVTQSDLKKMDIWSLGLLAYAVVNPNLISSYRKESELLGEKFNTETMKHLMLMQQLPNHDKKYESLRVTQWWQANEVFIMCAKFDPNSRPVAEDILKSLNVDDPEASLVIKPLTISQNSSLENADATAVGYQLQNKSMPQAEFQPQVLPLNDGTNACTFIAIAMCDAILDKQKTGGDQSLTWTDLTELAEISINEVPRKINEFRDSTRKYEPSEAKAILEVNEFLTQRYELSEECVSDNGVFSDAGRSELISALSKIPVHSTVHVGVYTCTPYSFMIGIQNDSFFLVDTHPIGDELGGNGNGILVATSDRSSRSCRLIIQWILKRIRISGVDQKTPQSLAWLLETAGTFLLINIHLRNKMSILINIRKTNNYKNSTSIYKFNSKFHMKKTF
jgi:serine/threonine protein kinase